VSEWPLLVFSGPATQNFAALGCVWVGQPTPQLFVLLLQRVKEFEDAWLAAALLETRFLAMFRLQSTGVAPCAAARQRPAPGLAWSVGCQLNLC
jgi:hypothetical protein